MTDDSTPGGVLVAGSINMDIVARAPVLPVPGQTVQGRQLAYYQGGKGANQAIAAQRAGAATRFVGKVGDDAFGGELRRALALEGIDVTHLETAPGPSGVALIVVRDDGENSIVIVPGANDQVDVDILQRSFATPVPARVAVCQYEIPIPSIEACFAECRARGITTVLNTAPAVAEVGTTQQLADVLVLNETELAQYAGATVANDLAAAAAIAMARQLRRFPEQVLIVTLGASGVVAVAGERELAVPGIAVTPTDTTGAGDCFVGYLAAGLAAGADVAAAIERANQAASLCVQRHGAGPSIPQGSELAPRG